MILNQKMNRDKYWILNYYLYLYKKRENNLNKNLSRRKIFRLTNVEAFSNEKILLVEFL